MSMKALLATVTLAAMTLAFLVLASPAPHHRAKVAPVAANLSDLDATASRPAREHETDSRIDSSFTEAELLALQEEALRLPPSPAIQILGPADGTNFSIGTNFDSMDVTECCQSGTLNPPDPELAVGPNHIIAVVNSSLEIYDKAGNSLVGPMPFEVFFSSIPGPCTDFPFDPNVLYDESADRFIVAVDGNGFSYCVGVTQTGDPTGAYHFYDFPTNVNGLFFDYPHAGVGVDASYVGANMFGTGDVGRVFACEKAAMYAGLPAASANQGPVAFS